MGRTPSRIRCVFAPARHTLLDLARVVFGTIALVMAALGMSSASRAVNTSFVERQNGTDRHRNARKVRKTYRFSKDRRHHEAVTYLSMYIYNSAGRFGRYGSKTSRAAGRTEARRWRPAWRITCGRFPNG